MMLKIVKSKTFKVGESYRKTVYELMKEDVADETLESTKRELENKINHWLEETPSEPIKSEPKKPIEKTCAECGKVVKGNYKLCYNCFQKNKGD
jgi:hypothetical protein